MTQPYWKTKRLAEMDGDEWEGLCDGCALCCLRKLEDEDTGEVFFTEQACRLLDTDTCRCTDYGNRTRRVRDCLRLSADQPEHYAWLPSSCAYRRLAEGRDLPAWHYLVCGDRDAVHEAGISARAFARHADEDEPPSTLLKLD